MADVVITGRTLVREKGKFYAAPARMREELRLEMNDWGEDSKGTLRAAAPVDRSLLRSSIEVNAKTGTSVGADFVREITAGVEDPQSGYNYLRVSRFGHRKPVIFGRPLLGGTGRRPTVKYPTFIASKVKGYRPAGDWVARTEPRLRLDAREAKGRMAGRLRTRVF